MDFVEGNIFTGLASQSKEEIFNPLFSSKNIKIEQIISSGQTSPARGWYDQEQHEWVVLVEGEATLEFENSQKKKLQKGDYIFIPAHTKHKVFYTSANPPCIWLAVFFNDN
ncbi:MAG TPA: cupin domain-containing protein [Bacteroidales bacterium]|nr:cupin domain-containing protein [Paludibacteraceae bacterium]HOH83982.1 cupin domain-containing protein [Bacteroidales bacterium]HPI29982.1 cupin domain-containing protein [Bacteroidales bacterium]HQN16501.1 cupin domain-containing protein [Bacteroidales bacterium]HQP16165.1 cupin domain-containing protein [Bacteroidales bacterium]